MKLDDNTFYVVQSTDGLYLYQEQSESIEHLREHADEIEGDDPDISISEVIVDGDDWTIKQLPWQRIAINLVRNED